MTLTALPPAGDTHDHRPAEAPQTDALSLTEASQTYGVSVTTLRRLLRAGDVAGAFQVPGPKGREWRLPAGSLEALGYQAVEKRAQSEAAPAAPVLDLSALDRSLATLTDLLTEGQRQLMAAEQDRDRAAKEREEARIDAARLEAQLEAAQAKVSDLETRLEAATARRGIFRRRKPSKAS